jgi:hypothetical protein
MEEPNDKDALFESMLEIPEVKVLVEAMKMDIEIAEVKGLVIEDLTASWGDKD